MSLPKLLQNYTGNLKRGFKSRNVNLNRDIEVDDENIPKGTEGSLMYKKQNGNFHFEVSSLDIAFEVSEEEFDEL